MKTDLSADEQELLALLDPVQALGNGQVRQQLGWSEDRYEAAKAALVARQLVELGRGPGQGQVYVYFLCQFTPVVDNKIGQFYIPKSWANPASITGGSGFPRRRPRINGLTGFPLQSVTRNAGPAFQL